MNVKDRSVVYHSLEPSYAEYVSDESRMRGRAECICFPENEDQIREALQYAQKKGWPVTLQGKRTGITGGAVPSGGLVMNLDAMNRIFPVRIDQQRYFVTVQPGVSLSVLNRKLADHSFEVQTKSTCTPQEKQPSVEKSNIPRLFFPPDPTETSASIGGMIANNASGACSFLYGPTRKYVHRIKVMSADGDSFTLTRGVDRVVDGRYSIKTDLGRIRSGTLEDIERPSGKNAAGYLMKSNMDMVDLWVGSEGTLGIVTEAELLLLPYPEKVWGTVCFFKSSTKALAFVTTVRAYGKEQPFAQVAAIEYFDRQALRMFHRQKSEYGSYVQLPDIDPDWECAVYVELHGQNEEQMTQSLQKLGDDLQQRGGDRQATFFANHAADVDRLKTFRHAIPESVNMWIDRMKKTRPDLVKMGTDMAVPDVDLKNLLQLYENGIKKQKLDAVMFGHIGDHHIHVNILPADRESVERGKQLVELWAHTVSGWGGTVSAEHGIGKLKKHLFGKVTSQKTIEAMRKVKACFDPTDTFNRGNLFDS